MGVSNEDCSPFGIDGCDVTQTPTGFLEIVDDEFPRVVPKMRSTFHRRAQ
jgi:hypothetical protein